MDFRDPRKPEGDRDIPIIIGIIFLFMLLSLLVIHN